MDESEEGASSFEEPSSHVVTDHAFSPLPQESLVKHATVG